MMSGSGWNNVCCHFSAHMACVQTHPLAYAHPAITCAFWRASQRSFRFPLQMMKVLFRDMGVCLTKPNQCTTAPAVGSCPSAPPPLACAARDIRSAGWSMLWSQVLLLDPHWVRDPVQSCAGTSAEAVEWSVGPFTQLHGQSLCIMKL